MAKTPQSTPTPPETETRSGEVGALLRKTREASGRDLRTVADALRIRHGHLLAIEEGRYDELPGATYAVGFVRAYAEYLGLDGNEVVRRFKDEDRSLPSKNDLSFPVPVNEGGIPSGALIVIAILLAAVIYGGWYVSTATEGSLVSVIQNIPDRLNALVHRTPVSAVPAPGQDTPANSTSQSAASTATASSATRQNSNPLAAMPSAPESTATPNTDNAPAKPASTTQPAATDTATSTATSDSAPDSTGTPATPMQDIASPDADTADPAQADTTAAPVTDAATAEQAAQQAEADARAAAMAKAEADARARAAELAKEKAEAQAKAEAEAREKAAASAQGTTTAATTASTETQATAETVTALQQAASSPTPTETPAGRVVIIAKADSWIQIRGSQGVVMSRLLRSGDRFDVPAGEDMTLRTGNAGGTVIMIDGKALPPLGETGKVISGLSLAPSVLLSHIGQ